MEQGTNVGGERTVKIKATYLPARLFSESYERAGGTTAGEKRSRDRRPAIITRPRVGQLAAPTVQRPRYGGWSVTVHSPFLSPLP